MPQSDQVPLASTTNEAQALPRHAAEALRVLVLEDQAEARSLLADALAGLGARIGRIDWAFCLADFHACVDAGVFDVCLIDLGLPDGSGVEAIRRLRALPVVPTVLVVSALSDDDAVLEAIMAGASGYVSKYDAPDDLTRAIAIAAEGGACIGPAIAARVMGLMRRHADVPAAGATPCLTPREHEVLRLAARGSSYRQIAEMTATKPSTIYTHVRHIYEKLHVSNLQQALFQARMRRLV